MKWLRERPHRTLGYSHEGPFEGACHPRDLWPAGLAVVSEPGRALITCPPPARESERDIEREREIEREIERERESDIYIERVCEIEIHIYREGEQEREREIDRQRENESERERARERETWWLPAGGGQDARACLRASHTFHFLNSTPQHLNLIGI